LKAEASQKRKVKPKEGKVIRKSGDKSILVEVTRRVVHPAYKKIVKKKKRFMVHDEENKARVGDIISFTESRPFSKRKRWKLLTAGKKKGT
jgi:small subunit ribosomal protein S17